MKRNRAFIVLLAYLFTVYGSLSLFADLFHDHDPDCSYIDECPACQWVKQVQDDHSEFENALKQFLELFVCSSRYQLFENTPFYDQAVQNQYFSRAPPFSHTVS